MTGLLIAKANFAKLVAMPDTSLDEDHSKDLATIKDWLKKQPHLPNEVGDKLLKRFLYSCKFSLEKTKSTIDVFFTIRSSSPEIFCTRDPMSPEIQRIFSITDMIPLPNKTKDNYKVFLYRLNNPNLDLYNFVDSVKTFFMLADVRLTEESEIQDGEIPIFDSANISLKFITKVNLSVLKKYMLYTQEALPIRLKQVHIINSPAYIDKLFALVKPFLKSEVSKLVHFHQPNSESLYKFVPRELLPNEYGGKAGTVADIKQHWVKRIEAKRDFFLNDHQWEVDEKLRPAGARSEATDKILNMQGTFKTLAID